MAQLCLHCIHQTLGAIWWGLAIDPWLVACHQCGLFWLYNSATRFDSFDFIFLHVWVTLASPFPTADEVLWHLRLTCVASLYHTQILDDAKELFQHGVWGINNPIMDNKLKYFL